VRTPPRRSCAVFFHQGAPPLSEGALRTEPGLEALRAAAATHLSAAGQQQVATALDMLAATEAQLGPLTCWLAGKDRFSSSRKAVRFTGLDITVHSPRPQRPPRPAVPARTAGAALGAV
jgi:hypothetical protein